MKSKTTLARSVERWTEIKEAIRKEALTAKEKKEKAKKTKS